MTHGGFIKGLVNVLKEMLPEYYQTRGWDAKGTVTSETRDRLGLPG